MASCSLLVVVFSCVLKVGSLPTPNTVVPPKPTSKLPIDAILDSPYHHGQAPEQSPHQHHNSPNSHNHHVNKTLASLESLMHHLLDKDESHVTPVVQSFTGCVTSCMHPKHSPNPPDDAGEDGHDRHGYHNAGPDVHTHQSPNHPEVPDTHGDRSGGPEVPDTNGDRKGGPDVHVHTEGNSNDDLGDLRSAVVLNQIGKLLRDNHPSPAGGHPDDDISRYWMCSHMCLGSVIG